MPVSLERLKQLLRDHYEGTPFDMTKGPAAGPWGSPTRWSAGEAEAALEGG